jgi:hypothetical protein
MKFSRPRFPWFPLPIASALLLLSASTASALDATPPASFAIEAAPLETIVEVAMPPLDIDRYVREDEERAASEPGGPYRFAAAHETSITTESAGTWETMADGSRIWRYRVRSEGALSLNFGFSRFLLPEGATIHVYDPERRNVYGPYIGEQAVEGEFWTPILPGDRAVIELFVPAGAAFEPEIVLASVNHDYRGFGEIAAQKTYQGSCNNDVVCAVGDPWRDEIRSVGVYTVNGTWTCSGQMVNSNQDDPPPYFLTANHCGVSTSNDQTVRVYWNYESPTCGVLCCGSLADNQYGSLLRAKFVASDFCLIELSAEPDTSFHVYYAGWDATGAAVSSATCIHHPNTDEKAISFQYDALTVTTYLQNGVPGDGTHWRVDDWEDGTTEPGSSGSGLWDQNHRLVGQLHGGYASCTSLTSDWYGRIYRSWEGGGASSNRLRDWLDPAGTGMLVLDGIDPNAIDTGVESGRPLVGSRRALLPVTPNPTRGRAEIFFDLDRSGVVETEIFSASGRLVETLPARTLPAGAGSVLWEGGSGARGALPAGIYFVRIRVNGETLGTEKVVLLR